MRPPSLIPALGIVSLAPWLWLTPPALAQVEQFMLKSRSQVGPTTEVKPKNCKTAKDGSVTCDTELVKPPGNTPAKPPYNPFTN